MTWFDTTVLYLGYVNMLAWFIAAGASLRFRIFFPKQAMSWSLILIGSLFVLGRQIIKLFPAYKVLDVVYMSRYLVGLVGAIILFIGFLRLYEEAKA